MFVIGLTGGIGTGKTVVSAILRRLGAEVLDADHMAHQVYRRGAGPWREIVDEFGEEVLAADGEIDRPKLGSVVFRDEGARHRLNRIVHPALQDDVEQRLSKLREQGMRVAVVEAAILFEAGWQTLFDEVWVTVVDEAAAASRTARRGRLSLEEVRARMASQMGQTERVRQADAVVDNNGSFGSLEATVERLWAARIPLG